MKMKLDEARRRFGKPPKKEIEPVETSSVDMKAMREIKGKTPSRETDKIISRGRFNLLPDNNDAILNFGKHQGLKISTLAEHRDGQSYLRWMLSQDFPELVKEMIHFQLKIHMVTVAMEQPKKRKIWPWP
jgi:uncharacterized protein (DUF3820 family)